MPTAENTYPKTGNDPIYASELNALNFCYSSDTTEAGPYTHTGDTSLTLKRTYTVGGISGLGTKLVVITFNYGVTANSGFIEVRKNDESLFNLGTDSALVSNGFRTSGSGTQTGSVTIPIDNGDTIKFYLLISSAGSTVSVSNIKFWTTDQKVTFTGS